MQQGNESDGQNKCHHRRCGKHRHLSPDELRVIKECKRESFYQRSLPLASLLGISTYYGVKSGFLRPNSRFGAIPKVTLAVLVGYVIGKCSYRSTCAEKLMALPDSKLGEKLRKYKEGNTSFGPGFAPGFLFGPCSCKLSGDKDSGASSDTGKAEFDVSEVFGDAQKPSV